MFFVTAISLGLALGAMCLGIFISLRIFNFPDITTDGSYTLGGVITALGIVKGIPLVVIFPLAIACGMLAGLATGWIHTRLKLNSLLSGILVMTGLYSINLYIMGKSNLPLPVETKTLFQLIPLSPNPIWNELFVLVLILFVLVVLLYLLLKTDFGLAMRATGNNAQMAGGLGINSGLIKIIGLALANGLVAISGFLVVQLQGFADINMGIGIVILGLGAVMIGESLYNMIGGKRLFFRITGAIGGSVLFRLILSLALIAGIDPIWLKLLTACIVLIIVGIPGLIPAFRHRIKLD